MEKYAGLCQRVQGYVEKTRYTRCTKMKKTEKKVDKKWGGSEKVIHIKNNAKMEKNELYTKLYTLST